MSAIGSLPESSIYSTDVFGIDNENLKNLADQAKDYAVSKGIAMRAPDLTFDARVPVPFCLVPTPFPEKWFLLAKSIQRAMNYVLHQIAHSHDFLYSCLENTIKTDEFTSNIWRIYEAVESERTPLPISLGLLRCDYMLDTNSEGQVSGIKQVESNTFASSFSGLSPGISTLHRYIISKLGKKPTNTEIPDNEALCNMAKGLVAAWDVYGKKSAAILFVVEDVTFNICDQRATEFAICEIEDSIDIMRRTFNELRDSATLEENCLIVDGKEIAVVYYRYGYAPNHYKPKDWELRLLMERSCAVKCPSVGYHLAGTKRVQLQLTVPGVLEQFLPLDVQAAEVRQVFAEQQSLDMNEDGDRAVTRGIENPDKYVMKPEREGGGNNIYGEDVKKLLQSIGQTQARMAYILMEKIKPPHALNCIVRSGSIPKVTKVLAELGMYGVILGNKDTVLKNYEAGHVLRSKEVGINEGGIAAGFGALDSPYIL